MPQMSQRAAYDAARNSLMVRIEMLGEVLALELAKKPQNRVAIETLEVKIEELDLEHTLTRIEDFQPAAWP